MAETRRPLGAQGMGSGRFGRGRFAPAESFRGHSRLDGAGLPCGVSRKAVFNTDTNVGVLGRDIGMFERTQPFSLDFWFRASNTRRPVRGLRAIPVLNHKNDSTALVTRATCCTLEKNPGVRDVAIRKPAMASLSSRPRSRCRCRPVDHIDGHVRRIEPGQRRQDVSQRKSVPASVDVMRDNSTARSGLIPISGGIGSATGGFLGGCSSATATTSRRMKEGGLDEIRVFTGQKPSRRECARFTTPPLGRLGNAVRRKRLPICSWRADPSVKAAEKRT